MQLMWPYLWDIFNSEMDSVLQGPFSLGEKRPIDLFLQFFVSFLEIYKVDRREKTLCEGIVSCRKEQC